MIFSPRAALMIRIGRFWKFPMQRQLLACGMMGRCSFSRGKEMGRLPLRELGICSPPCSHSSLSSGGLELAREESPALLKVASTLGMYSEPGALQTPRCPILWSFLSLQDNALTLSFEASCALSALLIRLSLKRKQNLRCVQSEETSVKSKEDRGIQPGRWRKT